MRFECLHVSWLCLWQQHLIFHVVFLPGIQTNDHNAWQLYTKIQEQSGLPLRVYMTPSIGELREPATPRAGSKAGLLSCDRIKLFSDGSLGAVRVQCIT